MQSKFMAAINQLATEKNLPIEKVIEIVSHALRAAYRKDYGNRDQNIEVSIDAETSVATVYKLMEVMQKEQDIENPDAQFLLDEAKKLKKTAKVGDMIRIDVTPPDYGRIAAQSAKQVIIQQIQEAEKGIITDMYLEREHEILNGYINRIEGANIYVDLDRTQAILRPQDQIPRESYQSGQRIKVYLDKVISTPKGPRLLISRTHPRLVNCLLELEIPEIRDKTVEIKSVAREPGVRTKVAVSSNDRNVDPIGACVGQRGVRIQNVMEEFNNERIDIIEYLEEPKKFLAAALAPAKITYIELNEGNKHAAVYVEIDQRALAIGKGGQNVRLASMLTGWEVDIIDVDKLDPSKVQQEEKKDVEMRMKKKEEKPVSDTPEDIKELPGITPEIAEKLQKTGFVKSIQLMGLNAEVLSSIEGISPEESIIIEAALKGGVKNEDTKTSQNAKTSEHKELSEEKKASEHEKKDQPSEGNLTEVQKPEKPKKKATKKTSKKEKKYVTEEVVKPEEDTKGKETVIAPETKEEEAVVEEKAE